MVGVDLRKKSHQVAIAPDRERGLRQAAQAHHLDG
jgi:hypothetical protein